MKSGMLKGIGAIAVLALVSMACGAAVPTIAVPTVDIQAIATQIVPVDNGGDSQPQSPADNGGGQLL